MFEIINKNKKIENILRKLKRFTLDMDKWEVKNE